MELLKKIHYIIFLIRVRDAKDKFDLEGILYKNVGVYFFIIYKGIPTWVILSYKN